MFCLFLDAMLGQGPIRSVYADGQPVEARHCDEVDENGLSKVVERSKQPRKCCRKSGGMGDRSRIWSSLESV
jgi:hypothetical protein